MFQLLTSLIGAIVPICVEHRPINATPRRPSDGMSKFKITVARIEVDARGKRNEQVRITFQIDRAPISFQVPILMDIRDFDDTEMVQAARSALHRTFVELAAQSQKWKLTAQDLRQLSSMSLRPKT